MILVLDDNFITLKMMQRFIEKTDDNVTIVLCCEAASIQDLVVNNVDRIKVIFTDLNLADGTEENPRGIQLIQHIRQIERDSMTNPIEIIAFSGSENLKKAALDAGADAFYVKPLTFNQISKIIKNASNS